MKMLKALSQINHDGRLYTANETFKVDDDKQAQALLDAKAAAEVVPEPDVKGTDTKGKK